jgi:GxxExxY protein
LAFDGKHSELTEKVIGAFYKVYNDLGYGFSEKVYENALAIELKKLGQQVEQQVPIVVFYDVHKVGEYIADVLVESKVLLEFKAVRVLTDEHKAQLLSNLKATTIEVGLLLNFGPKAQVIRQVFDNQLKGSLHWTKLGQ